MRYKSTVDIVNLAHEINKAIVERLDFDEPTILQIFHCLDRHSHQQKYVDWNKMTIEMKNKAIVLEDKQKAYSADNHVLETGQKVWVNNTVLGYPPLERTVGKIVNRSIIDFDKPDPQGYIGCKAESCWISLEKAYFYALQQLDRE